MKKHNEGYALVLVLVVMVVLGLLSSIILTGSLRNVQSQQTAVTRMKDKYTAEAEIEKIVAALRAVSNGTVNNTIPLPIEDVTITLPEEQKNQIEITAKSGSVQIDVVLLLEGEGAKITLFTTEQGDEYSVSNATGVRYISYEISTVTQGGSEQ